jgi:hypothetical protein
VVTSQPAGRRIPLRLKLVSGDALGERDDRTIVTDRSLSNFAALTNRTVGKSVDRRTGRSIVIDATYPHRFAARIEHVRWVERKRNPSIVEAKRWVSQGLNPSYGLKIESVKV